MENRLIWDQVEKTNPAGTKQAKVNGQSITSINAHYLIERATEIFGPAGIGWGWNVVEERFDNGGEIRNDKGDVIGSEVGHTVRISFWFYLGDKRGEIQQYGCTPFTYKSKWGVTTDTEAPKKSLTDAIKKALSMLGFSADIFKGQFDDVDYVLERQEEAAIAEAEDKEAEIARQKEERLTWLKNAIETMESAVTVHELTKLHATYVRNATRRKEDAYVTRLARTFEEKKTKLDEMKNEQAV
jgi:hypothetical protein